METKQLEAFTEQEHYETSHFCNVSDSTRNCSILLYDGTPESIIVPCIFSIILIVGLVGNALLIFSFARHKTLSTPHNALVVNLASGDFIFLIVSLPFNMVWYTLPNWPFGLVVCKLSNFAEMLSMTVVILTLSVLSVERCLIVTGKKLWRQQKQGPIWLTVSLWTVSLLVSLPSLISANLVKKVINNETYTFCFHYDEILSLVYSRVHVALMFIFLFCLPLLVITTAYILIAVHLLLRAFPLLQRNTKTQKSNGSIKLHCFRLRKTEETHLSAECDEACTAKQVNRYEEMPIDDVTVKNGDENSTPLQTAVKSQSSTEKEGNQSYSPDSCTEMTELQQTPVLPYSFVYTGPLSADSLKQQETQFSKLNAADSSRNEHDSSSTHLLSPPTTSAITWKETSPLNPSVNSDPKPGYQQRQRTMVTKRRRLALTVLMLIIVFTICWTPRHIYLIWYNFVPDDFDTFWNVFKIIGFCLSASNSAVNPVVFYILDTTYRSFVHKSLCLLCMRRCQRSQTAGNDAGITLGERDYNATIAMSEMKSKGIITQL